MSRRPRPTWEEDRKAIAVRSATHERLTRTKAKREKRENRSVTFDEIIRLGLDALDKQEVA